MKSVFNRMLNNILKDKTDSLITKSPLLKYFTLGIVGISFFLVIIVVVITIIFAPIMMAQQYIEDVKNSVSLFFEKVGNAITLNGWCADSDGSCQRKAEQKYYEKLDEVYKEYKEDGVEIDVQLITGTMFYGNTLSEDKFQNDEEDDSEELSAEIHVGDIKKLAKNMVSGGGIDYAKYRKYLVETYIPKRYEDMYSDEKAIERIADEIMSFASGKVPDKTFAGSSCVIYNCNNVFLTGDYAGEYTLEDYIKGVVNAESGGFSGYTKNYKEQWKAQAITARSMVLKQYDICTQSVPNTTDFQKFKPNWSQELSDVVDETAGMVLSDNGDVFLAQYDAFYEGNGSNYHCDGDLCYSTYYKKGSGTDPTQWEKHEISTYSKYTSSFAPYPNGHGIGMSQWGAAYLADIGKNYEEILNYYYADNIKISKVGNSCSVDTSGYDWRQADPRWGNKSYGGATLGDVGCNFTSIVIQIARSGKQTTLSDFNPGTAFDVMKANGQLGYGGDTLNYANFTLLAPDFKFAGTVNTPGYSHDQIREKIAELIKNNKYPIIHVMSGYDNLPYATNNHWVAAVGYTDDDIEIVDPAQTGCTRLFTCKPGLDKTNGYATVDQIHYWE